MRESKRLWIVADDMLKPWLAQHCKWVVGYQYTTGVDYYTFGEIMKDLTYLGLDVLVQHDSGDLLVHVQQRRRERD